MYKLRKIHRNVQPKKVKQPSLVQGEVTSVKGAIRQAAMSQGETEMALALKRAYHLKQKQKNDKTKEFRP